MHLLFQTFMFPSLDGQSYKHMLRPTATLSLLPSSLFCLEYVPQKLPTLTGVGGIHVEVAF